jgi:hypothetical protein
MSLLSRAQHLWVATLSTIDTRTMPMASELTTSCADTNIDANVDANIDTNSDSPSIRTQVQTVNVELRMPKSLDNRSEDRSNSGAGKKKKNSDKPNTDDSGVTHNIQKSSGKKSSGMYVLSLQDVPGAHPENAGRLDQFRRAWTEMCQPVLNTKMRQNIASSRNSSMEQENEEIDEEIVGKPESETSESQSERKSFGDHFHVCPGVVDSRPG